MAVERGRRGGEKIRESAAVGTHVTQGLAVLWNSPLNSKLNLTMESADASTFTPDLRTRLALWFYRLAPGLRLPASWWVPEMKAARISVLEPNKSPSVEVVSHCWNYAHLLAYQLSSVVQHPSSGLKLTMTVCYCKEDRATVKLLEFFSKQAVPNVTWNWLPLERVELMRRAIGRNRAAIASKADWVWFTDCDLLFYEGCLSGLAAALAGRTEPLVYPQEERCTSMLASDDAMLTAATDGPRFVEIVPDRFDVQRPKKATGPLQIVRGDLARKFGYCDAIKCYQTPTDRWRKTYEDRAFRWLLGSQGTPINVPGVYRIKHIEKGRYYGPKIMSRVRSEIRQAKAR